MNKIKVKRELLADWLAALRSSKYKQGITRNAESDIRR